MAKKIRKNQVKHRFSWTLYTFFTLSNFLVANERLWLTLMYFIRSQPEPGQKNCFLQRQSESWILICYHLLYTWQLVQNGFIKATTTAFICDQMNLSWLKLHINMEYFMWNASRLLVVAVDDREGEYVLSKRVTRNQ